MRDVILKMCACSAWIGEEGHVCSSCHEPVRAVNITALERDLAEANELIEQLVSSIRLHRDALLELRVRLHASGRRPNECYELDLIDDVLTVTEEEAEEKP